MKQPMRYMGRWDEFYTILGHCLDHWQTIEHNLFDVFWALSLHEYLPIPATIFNHIRAFDQKCVLTDKLAAIVLAGTPESEAWKGIYQDMITAGRKRDRLVHYSFHQNKDGDLIVGPSRIDFARRYQRNSPSTSDKAHYMGITELRAIKSEFSDLMVRSQMFANHLAKSREQLRLSHERFVQSLNDRLSKKATLPKRKSRATPSEA